MNNRFFLTLSGGWLVACFCLLSIGAPQAQGKNGVTLVLDTSGYWRVHHTFMPPVLKDGREATPLATLTGTTPLPPKDWTQPDFDDGQWLRQANKPLPGSKANGVPDATADSGAIGVEHGSPALGLTCLRARFQVNNPSAVRNLSLSLAYRGGVAVYLNGKELARGHLAANAPLDSLAEDYPPEAFFKSDGTPARMDAATAKDAAGIERCVGLRVRRLPAIEIPATRLVRGVNVLAIEIHRSTLPSKLRDSFAGKQRHEWEAMLWNTCALVSARLTSDGTAGLVPNVTRPEGMQVWNSTMLAPDYDLDYGDPCEPLQPIRMVAPRQGMVSCKVVVGSDRPIKNLRGRVSELASQESKIPAADVQVRYAMPWGIESSTPVGRFPAPASLMDGLEEVPPDEVPVRAKKLLGPPYVTADQPPFVFGAVAPVWVTVAVPADAAPGEYRGTLTISSAGMGKPVAVPLELKVCSWRCPPPGEFRTIVNIMESPESVAMQYGVPLWGPRHWELLAKSLDRLGYVGNWTLFVTLIGQTNLGNEQTMVRWVRKEGAGARVQG